MLQIKKATVKAGSLRVKDCFTFEGEHFMIINVESQITDQNPDPLYVICFDSGRLGQFHKSDDVFPVGMTLEIANA